VIFTKKWHNFGKQALALLRIGSKLRMIWTHRKTPAFRNAKSANIWCFRFIICPIAIAYSMGQIIKSVCVCVCVCVRVLLRTVSTAAIYQKTHLSNADIMSTADIGS